MIGVSGFYGTWREVNALKNVIENGKKLQNRDKSIS